MNKSLNKFKLTLLLILFVSISIQAQNTLIGDSVMIVENYVGHQCIRKDTFSLKQKNDSAGTHVLQKDLEVKNMSKNECSIEFDSTINAFVIKMLGNITQQDIYECNQNFEKMIAEHCRNKKFNILLYMDHESHNLENVRLIRSLTSTSKFRNLVNASAAVFKDSPNPGINGNEGNFSNTEDAVEFLKRKNVEKKVDSEL